LIVPSDLLHSILSNLWITFLVLLFFGGSIFVHELGHFLVARRRGAHVERFSIGFGPAIWSWHGRDGVEYRISWFPLGGYVLLPQLADLGVIEGQSRTDVKQLPPVSYTTKMLVFIAGAAFNILFAFSLACIIWVIGQPVATAFSSTTIAEISEKLKTSDNHEVVSPAAKAGLKSGDVITAVDGAPVATFADIQERVALSSGWRQGERETILSIRRGADTFDVAVQPVISGPEKVRMIGFQTVAKLVIGSVTAGSPAAKAGLQPDDQIMAVNGNPVLTFTQLDAALRSSGMKPVDVSVLRRGSTMHVTLAHGGPGTDPGISFTPAMIMTHPTPWAQIVDSMSKTFRPLFAFVNPRSDIGINHASGPIGIIGNFVEVSRAGIRIVLWFTIIVNVNLAILNLLPVPVLDGGQMVFATIARLRGRALPPNFVMAAQSVFFVLIFALIGYISVFVDIPRWSRDAKAERAAEAAEAQKNAPANAAPAAAPAK
jgi:regulator of sigma E protease